MVCYLALLRPDTKIAQTRKADLYALGLKCETKGSINRRIFQICNVSGNGGKRRVAGQLRQQPLLSETGAAAPRLRGFGTRLLPRPLAVELHLERKTEESSNQYDSAEH